MEMNKETLDQLQQNQTLSQINEKLDALHVDYKAIALPDGYHLNTVENFQIHRNQYRAKFETDAIKSFEEYCARFAMDGSACYIQAEEMTAKTLFDIGSVEKPLHCKHGARLSLKRSPEFEEVMNVRDEKFSQRNFAEWLEEWADYLIPYNAAGEAMPVSTAVSIIRNIEFKDEQKSEYKVDDFAESATLMEQSSVQGGSAALPCGFEFRCVPYSGLLFDGEPTTAEEKSEGHYSFKFRLTVSRQDRQPIFNFKALLFDQKLLQIANDFQARLKRDFEQSEVNIKIYLGDCQH